MEIKWSVEKVIVSGDTKLITQVYWRCDASKNELTTGASGICDLIASDSFIPYDQLTEQQVLDWCFAPKVFVLDDQTTITTLLKDEVEAQVAKQIASQVIKKSSEPSLPWVTI
jgi:hypothetical protein